MHAIKAFNFIVKYLFYNLVIFITYVILIYIYILCIIFVAITLKWIHWTFIMITHDIHYMYVYTYMYMYIKFLTCVILTTEGLDF